MSLYRVAADKLEPVLRTTFVAENLFERRDLQRLLRQDISPIGDGLLVIAEEYGEWEESSRRIDLFCLSKEAGLVVVEIKRTDDGGHMELQALRYAAMVSSMTLEQVIRAYARTCGGDEEEARRQTLDFLGLDSADDAELTGEVRIILVSADFSPEVTTTVLWLNKHDLNITCIRLRPHRLGDDVLIDATQIIPLPEASDYEVKVREQVKEQRKANMAASPKAELCERFWTLLIERSKERTSIVASRKPSRGAWLWADVKRAGFVLGLSFAQGQGKVECYIDLRRGKEANVAALRALEARREVIEHRFGGALEWLELAESGGTRNKGTRICAYFPGNMDSPEEDWPGIQDTMIDALIRLDAALDEPIQSLTI